MEYSNKQIESELLKLIGEVTQDWDYSGTIGVDTLLFSELGFESLDIVVFATAIQKHYQQQMPFAELFAELGREIGRDLSISELAEFVTAQFDETAKEATSS